MPFSRRQWLRRLLPLAVSLTATPLAWARDWKTSVARFSADGETAPRIRVSGTQVQVSHRARGSGKVRGTVLRGQRTYRFASSGTYTVESGQYQHVVFGDVAAGGAIESVVRYQ